MSYPQIPAQVVVFDLEYTAWTGSMAERWLRPGQYREIVQIGAVRIDAVLCEEMDALEILVKPRINPVLSRYFEDLTGISNAELATRGVDIEEAIERFERFAGGLPTWAFGRDDLIFRENARLYGINTLPPPPQYANIAPWIRANGLSPRHAGDVAEAAGLAFAGRKHNALWDARSVVQGIKTLIVQGAKSPFVSRE